jgi:hypothetical protein
MTRIDQAVSGRPASETGGSHERPSQDACRRFARCVTMARTGSPPEDPPGGAATCSSGGMPPPVAGGLPGGVPGGVPSGAVAHTDPAGSQLTVVPGAYGSGTPSTSEERPGLQEGPGGMVAEPVRPQALALAANFEPPAPLGSDTPQAMALARSLFRELPLAAARERTLTVSFPAAGGAVEQIVLSTSGGIVSLVITARAEARERVAAALPELARLLRSRGLRIASVGLD